MLLLFSCAAPSAHAYSFGTQEELRYVAPMHGRSRAPEMYYLGRKVHTRSFLLPFMIHDDGFVIGLLADRRRYIPFPSETKVKELQAAGMLPDPLPEWHLNTADRLYGNALWEVFAALIFLGLAQGWWHRRRARQGQAAARASPHLARERAEHALTRRLAEGNRNDPLFGARLGGGALFGQVLAAFKAQQPGAEVYMASLVSAIGALAGYAAQAALRAQAQLRGAAQDADFEVARDARGRTVYAGAALRAALTQGPASVWVLALEAARRAGCTDTPDLEGILRHHTESLNTDKYGVPRAPFKHRPKMPPAQAIETYWPLAAPVLARYCTAPAQWPLLMGTAVQEAITWSKLSLEPRDSLLLAVESAVAAAGMHFDLPLPTVPVAPSPPAARPAPVARPATDRPAAAPSSRPAKPSAAAPAIVQRTEITGIKVRRVKEFVGGVRGYKIYIDGKYVDSVGSGEQVIIPLAPDAYRFKLRIDWCASPEIVVRVRPGRSSVVECGTKMTAANARNVFALIAGMYDYFWVKQIETAD